MPNFDVAIIKEATAYDFSWRQLQRYHDVGASVSALLTKKNIPFAQKHNVQKQMRQMSYCLSQAHEFSKSALRSGPTTKALQAYYSLTALANAEILWRGDGDVSLDRRPNTSHRHGLDIVPASDVQAFSARPQTGSQGGIDGLFGLWRKHTQHLPHYGQRSIVFKSGASQTGHHKFSGMERLAEMPTKSITFTECLAHIPGMQSSLLSMGRSVKLARGRAALSITGSAEDGDYRHLLTILIHPCAEEVFNDVARGFLFPSSICECVQILDVPSGCAFTIDRSIDSLKYIWSSPENFSDTKDQLYYVGTGSYLNEFGYFYV